MTMITFHMVSGAKALLSSPADGSGANRQARARALQILKDRKDQLKEFLAKAPNSPLALNLELQIRDLDQIIKHKSYPLSGMTDYQRLEAYGWKLLHKGKRIDYYAKEDSFGKVWIACVPASNNWDIWFERNGIKLSLKK